MDQRNLQEDLLRSWMAMEVCIRGNRLLSTFSMNEMLVCNILYQMQQIDGAPVTAIELCSRTKLLQKYITDSAALYEGKVSTPPISVIGSTIGTHAGPGAIAVAFFGNK